MHTKNGFTLIELAIVFVIVGLIIGGILVARSLTDTTKAQAFVRQLQQFTVGVTNFQTRYQSIPGDSKLVSPYGNGNNVIEDVNGNSLEFTNEVANFWIHLSNTGFNATKTALTVSVPAQGITAGINVPEMVYGIKGTGAIAVNGSFVMAFTGGINDGNYLLMIGLPSNSGATINGQPAFRVLEAEAIDRKIDNGISSSGIIRSGVDGNGCTTSGTYNSVYNPTTPPCDLFYKINQYSL